MRPTGTRPSSTPGSRMAWIGILVWVASLQGTRLPATAAAEHIALVDDFDVPCAECHSDLLEGRQVHPPAAEGDCETCHEFTRSGETWEVALGAPEEELCLMCHENPAAAAEAVTVHYPAEEGSCATCHDPHSSSLESLFRPEGSAICLECHPDQEEQFRLPHPHGKVRVPGCPSCHDPHASGHPSLLHARGNDLCLGCHLGTAGEREQTADGEVILFDGRSIDPSRFERVPKLSLLQGNRRGHPTTRHPIAADRDPRDPEKPFGCLSCHRPHGSERPKLLIAGPGFGLCRRCHDK